ncbi:hypothetical protein JCGZ_12471 [Jatropha curcas]|uniref:Cytochrome P450 n=1 Tax=Jatropha curcas TaxID=180498 RepID=A0A067KIA7_JATCU|nr:cytochrome P450 81Q32 [Jatropha curcas]XP_037497137.1 cytochrome P450 81Q32 [Jatropha curcas]KDP32010.1 hypothetical protein JCGZ_12471 [Jatropha curcas]
MEGFLPIVSVLSFLFLLFKLWSHNKRTQLKLPPTPPALPVIGHLHLFKQPIHRNLQNLSQKYGSIFSLRCGSYPMIIISSPSAVEECFTKNDIVLANRPPLLMGKYLNYNHTTLVTAPYGDHWRNLRRISALEIFSAKRLDTFLGIRREEIRIFLQKLNQACCDGFSKVEMRPLLSELTFNIIMRMVTGKRYGNYDVEEARKFREMIREIFAYAEASYPGDFLPFLQWIDFQGYVKKVKALARRTDELLQGLIDRQRNDQNSSNKSMISHLLSLQESQPEYYTDEIVKGFILDIIFGGTESSALTIEWALSSLLKNPQVLEKAKDELDIKIGQESLMDELDISKLFYLQNIISETLRLYPAGPLLLPHLSSKDCTIEGYNVSKNTIVLVNAWAIHRNPNLWNDAEKFKPERFEEGESDAYCYKFMPFGHGRRTCPGMGLANKVVGFALGCMIQCFEWERVDGKEIDMTEGIGLSMPKAIPLEVMCKAREIMKVYSSL